MRFTNPNYETLTTEAILQQREVIEPLRREHMGQIVDSGLANRVVAASSHFNQPWNMGPITEATT